MGADAGHTWTDRRLEIMLGRVLRAGVVLSGLVVLAGGLLYLARYGHQIPDYHVFRGEPAALRSVGGIVAAAGALDGRGLIQLGLLLLVATPIARVGLSLIGFLRRRDWLYVGVTIIVLALLAFSLLGGLAPAA
jgi:uncharacterized membrane protein